MDIFVEDNLKNRLVLCGLKELEEHGVRDFSLRRVAALAQVSCAAPYRHFKDKEELIFAIISHVREGWNLLAEDIAAVCGDDLRGRILRICSAAVRFWIANGNFRSVLMSAESEFDERRRAEIALFDKPLVDALGLFGSSLDVERAGDLVFTVVSLVYGTVALIASGGYSAKDAIAHLELAVGAELSRVQNG